jgi:hypothetical protein
MADAGTPARVCAAPDAGAARAAADMGHHLFKFISDAFPGAALHPEMLNAREIAVKWGAAVRASGGPGAPLRLWGARELPMQEPRCQYVEHVTGVRRVPLECFTTPPPAAARAAAPALAAGQDAAAAAKEEPAPPLQPETYLEMARGSQRCWLRNVRRNATLQTQAAAFLLESCGALSIHLPPDVREGFLRDCGLWEAFLEGLGAEPGDADAAAAAPVSGAAHDGAPDGAGASSVGDSLIGMVVRGSGGPGLIVAGAADGESVEVLWDGADAPARVARREALEMLAL